MAKIETSTQNPAEASIFLRNTVGNFCGHVLIKLQNQRVFYDRM